MRLISVQKIWHSPCAWTLAMEEIGGNGMRTGAVRLQSLFNLGSPTRLARSARWSRTDELSGALGQSPTFRECLSDRSHTERTLKLCGFRRRLSGMWWHRSRRRL